jgi:hypothetical protein
VAGAAFVAGPSASSSHERFDQYGLALGATGTGTRANDVRWLQ